MKLNIIYEKIELANGWVLEPTYTGSHHDNTFDISPCEIAVKNTCGDYFIVTLLKGEEQIDFTKLQNGVYFLPQDVKLKINELCNKYSKRVWMV